MRVDEASEHKEQVEQRTCADWKALIAVLAIAVALRVLLLFSGQQYLRSDEAVVGLMAKHIVTRGELPLFLYGQPYGGGHAIVAYVAAPLFALFGRSAVLLTAISAAVSVVNVWLVWRILRKYFSRTAAVLGSILYATSPPVVYGAFLVNGGTESFCLALLALTFFLQAYMDDDGPLRNAALAGIFGGLAYYAMDYALLYPIGFGILWLFTGGKNKWRCIGGLIGGFLAGCLPLIVYNLTHDFAHLRHIFRNPAGPSVGFIEHFFGALAHALTEGLPAFFAGAIDDYAPATAWSWFHTALALVALVVLVYTQRGALFKTLRGISFYGSRATPLPPALWPVFFVALYMAMYGAAKFSLTPFRTPRYFLPLCPFVSMAIAAAVVQWRGATERRLACAVTLILAAGSAVSAYAVVSLPWHEEHRVRTHGEQLELVGRWLQDHNVEIAYAPYEIAWRLMFETDDRVLVSCEGFSPLPRYDYYIREVRRRAEEGKPFALVARRDFAFVALGGGLNAGPELAASFQQSLRRKRLPADPVFETEEFLVFYPLTLEAFRP